LSQHTVNLFGRDSTQQIRINCAPEHTWRVF